MSDRKKIILVVDDEPNNRKLLEVLLKPEGYIILTAGSGDEALAIVAQQPPDLILLDIMMPGLDGYQVAARLKAEPATRNIPIIMVTSLDDSNSKLVGLNSGAEEFLTKPVGRAELWVRVRNLLRLKEYSDFLANHSRLLEQEVQLRTAELRASYIETIITMTRAAEYRDEDTGAHVQRVSYYSKQLAETLGSDSVFIDNIFYASPMHDIGKIGISDTILLKPGRLTAEEFEVIKGHTTLGAQILGKSESPYLKMGAEIALNHHERWDGGGYPNGIKGDAIPLPARLMSICDVYDSLRSRRPYKPEYDHVKAVEIITRGDGSTQPEHFDPDILAAFKRDNEMFRVIFETYTTLD